TLSSNNISMVEMSFLFGSILTVPSSLIVIMFMLLFLIVSLTLFYYRDFLLLSYDPEFAQVKGVRVFPLYLLLIVLITFTVVMAVQAVGLILVIALLTIPAYVAESHVNQLKHMIMISVGLSLILVISGLFLAFKINFTVGPVIILLSVFLYLINLGMMTLQKKWRR
ncbi:MAG TPA: metal ABC transporter permease, partial [Fibrobacteraceae bacterium]|nr:metal ABC transporter permease [Fibrobacteraceae bacterium]